MTTTKKPRPVPKWQPAPDELIRVFNQVMAALPDAQVRKTFGYPSAFVNRQMFAALHQDSFILRLSEEDRSKFMKLHGAGPFESMSGRVMREYVAAPEALLNSKAKLQTWLDKSFAYAKSLPPKQPKVRTARGAKSKRT